MLLLLFHRDVFVKYGPIEKIKLISSKKIAFVNFVARKAAEEAIKDLYGTLSIKNVQLTIAWAKGSK
jgi:RNA recognition motif. (a.k.a. RRM, RBD, or RNP domain)